MLVLTPPVLYRTAAGVADEEPDNILPEQYAPLITGGSESPPRADLPLNLPASMLRAFSAQPSALLHVDSGGTPKRGRPLHPQSHHHSSWRFDWEKVLQEHIFCRIFLVFLLLLMLLSSKPQESCGSGGVKALIYTYQNQLSGCLCCLQVMQAPLWHAATATRPTGETPTRSPATTP